MLIRQCGGKVGGLPFHLNQIETSLVYYKIGQLGLGPTINGVFEGGKQEELYTVNAKSRGSTPFIPNQGYLARCRRVYTWTPC